MTASDLLEKIGDKLGTTATAKSVYGDPIRVGNKTVVPVAKVAYGFGGGFGQGHGRHGNHDADPNARHGEGGGGGGGVKAFPAGALEITEQGTRFVPFHDLRWLALTFAGGALMGAIFAKSRQ